MSVVAWDGHYVAADKQATCAECRAIVSKLMRLETGEVIAWTGNHDTGLLMAHWYRDGADLAKYPVCQQDKENWARLIVCRGDGSRVRLYEQFPISITLENPFYAWGAGRDFALGALAEGASVQRAVEIACRFSVSCGEGVESVDLYDWWNVCHPSSPREHTAFPV